MDQTQNAHAAASFIVWLIVALIATFIYLIPAIIVMWKLYTKASRPGWNAIVPIYASVVMAQIAEKPSWLGWLVGLSAFFERFLRILSLVYLIAGLYLLYSFAKKYDRGVGFWVALLLLPIVAAFMVDKANYKGIAVASATPTPPPAPTSPAPQV